MYHFCGSLYAWRIAPGRKIVVSSKLLAGTKVWESYHGGGGRSSKVKAVELFFRRILRRVLILSESRGGKQLE